MNLESYAARKTRLHNYRRLYNDARWREVASYLLQRPDAWGPVSTETCSESQKSAFACAEDQTCFI